MEKKKRKVLIVEDQFVEANDIQLMLEKAGYEVCGIARSVPIAQEIIAKQQPELVLLDIFLKGKLTGIDLARQLKEENIAFIYLSANSNEEILSQAKTTEPYGFIVKPFREKDLIVTLEIAHYRHKHSSETRARRETALLQQLSKVIMDGGASQDRLLKAAIIMQQAIPFDCMVVIFENAVTVDGNLLCYLRIGFDEYQVLHRKELANNIGLGIVELGKVLLNQRSEHVLRFYNAEQFDRLATESDFERIIGDAFEIQSMLSFPVLVQGEGDGMFYFFSRRSECYNSEHIGLLHRLQNTLGPEKNVIEKSTDVIHQKKNNIRNPGATPVNNISRSSLFAGIIGNCHLLLNVFDQISQVAPFDTSVLILGESGTGKEKIADCIHRLSPRNGKPFIKVNCAALPATLIESVLFGHEKGSFTGATEKRIGKFEQANGGTIFLDEIGEMPVDLQVKLLRVLQEREIEPIGSRTPIKIDVRFIAATNRNLEREVAGGMFRLDLYYRLNVFPIELPPLRQRIEDIPALALHFIEVYKNKASKEITGLSQKALQKMMAYTWPGNIRELEHVIERAVVMTRNAIIDDVILPVPISNPPVNHTSTWKTIDENERDHIIQVLKKCNGKIWGAGGAAELLNVPPSTLKSKMKKLRINKDLLI